MEYFAGLDVWVKETSVCMVDDTGKIVREVKVASEPDALLTVLGSSAYRFKRIGLEAANWTGSRAIVAMAVQRDRRSGFTCDLCRDAAHASGFEGADNKTDRNDARGIAQMMRGWVFIARCM